MRSWHAFLLASLVSVCATPGGRSQQAPEPPAASAPPVAPERATGPSDATALFTTLAQMEGLEARFTEEKHLALLAAPLRSRGRLYFLRPGYLVRVVEAPQQATLLLTPDELRMSGPEGTETLDLHQNDDLRVFVTSLVRVFSGDQQALESSYEITFVVDAEAWTLTLTPRDRPLNAMMKDLSLRGSGFEPAEIVVREPNGDRTVTRIEAADTQRRFTAEEKAQLFGIPPE